MRKDHNYLCIEYCSVFFKIIKTHEESTSTIADDGHYRKTELEEIHNCIRLYYDLCGRFRSDIAQSTDTGQQKCLTQPKSDRLGHAVNGGAKTICADSVLFFHMIQNFSQIGSHHIGGKASGGSDQQTDKYRNHPVSREEYNTASNSSKGESYNGYFFLAEFSNQRPEQGNAIAHGSLPDHIDQNLLGSTGFHRMELQSAGRLVRREHRYTRDQNLDQLRHPNGVGNPKRADRRSHPGLQQPEAGYERHRRNREICRI